MRKTSLSYVCVLVFIAIISFSYLFGAPLVNTGFDRIPEGLFLLSKSLTDVEQLVTPSQKRLDSEIDRLPHVIPGLIMLRGVETEGKTKDSTTNPGLLLWAKILVETIYQGSSNFV